MSRLQQVQPETATGKAKVLLDAVQGKLGLVPNMTRAMVNSPAVLDGYLGFSGALSKGSLSAKTREQIALAVAEKNGCEYCLAAHTTIGKMVGLSVDQLHDSRLGNDIDPKMDALLRFTSEVVQKHGQVSDADLQAVRHAGYDDGAIAEVVANVALNIFTNYFNHVANTDVDFPRVQPISHATESCSSGCGEVHA